MGNAGQSNYVAGNTYQTALARYRSRQLPLPAIALDLGKVAETGFVAENAGGASDANLDRVGLPGITEMEVLSMLEMAITSNNLSDNDLIAQDNGEREHIVTGIIDLVKSDSSGEREALFWGRDPIFSHMSYVRPQPGLDNGDAEGSQSQKADTVSLKEVVSTRDKFDDDKLLIEVLKALTRRIAKALMLAVGDVDHGMSPSDLGADSLVDVNFATSCLERRV